MSFSTRAVGNMARANPRLYSTHTEQAFTHRKAPPMPTFDHLLQPGREFVSFLSHRIHSVLGSAFMPYLMPEIAFATAPRPVMVATEVPNAYETALQLLKEEPKGWSWKEDSEAPRTDNKLALWSLSGLRLPTSSAAKLTSQRVSKPLFNIDRGMLALAAADVVLTMKPYDQDYSASDRHSQSLLNIKDMQPYGTATLITVPASYRSLDGDVCAPAQAEYVQVPVPAPESAQKLFFIAAATATATTAIVATATAALTSFIQKLW